jgi:hypothetical protein
LLGSQPLEHCDRAGVEADEVGLLRLGHLIHDHLVVERRHLAGDDRRAFVEVDVGPPQA